MKISSPCSHLKLSWTHQTRLGSNLLYHNIHIPVQRNPGWSQCVCAECHFGTLWAVRRAGWNESHWRICVALPLFPLWRSEPVVNLWGTAWTAGLHLCCCSGQMPESCRAGWGQYICTGRLEITEHIWGFFILEDWCYDFFVACLHIPLSWLSGVWHMSCNACMTSIIVFKIWRGNTRNNNLTHTHPNLRITYYHHFLSWPLVGSLGPSQPHLPKESLDRSWSFRQPGGILKSRKCQKTQKRSITCHIRKWKGKQTVNTKLQRINYWKLKWKLLFDGNLQMDQYHQNKTNRNYY